MVPIRGFLENLGNLCPSDLPSHGNAPNLQMTFLETNGFPASFDYRKASSSGILSLKTIQILDFDGDFGFQWRDVGIEAEVGEPSTEHLHGPVSEHHPSDSKHPVETTIHIHSPQFQWLKMVTVIKICIVCSPQCTTLTNTAFHHFARHRSDRRSGDRRRSGVRRRRERLSERRRLRERDGSKRGIAGRISKNVVTKQGISPCWTIFLDDCWMWGWAHCGHGDFWRGEVLIVVILLGSMVDFGAVFNFMIKSACRVAGVQTVLSKLLRGKAWQGMQQGVVGIPVLEIHGMDVDSICTCKREGCHYIIHIYIYVYIYIYVLHVLPGVSPCLSQIKSG